MLKEKGGGRGNIFQGRKSNRHLVSESYLILPGLKVETAETKFLIKSCAIHMSGERNCIYTQRNTTQLYEEMKTCSLLQFG